MMGILIQVQNFRIEGLCDGMIAPMKRVLFRQNIVHVGSYNSDFHRDI